MAVMLETKRVNTLEEVGQVVQASRRPASINRKSIVETGGGHGTIRDSICGHKNRRQIALRTGRGE